MDIMKAIQPKSDQLNADDLIAGPKVITVTEVQIVAGEQPISVFYQGDDGKPWKPCKSMGRIMVKAWGPDANQYAGRSLELYNDPGVKWAGQAVGGIRISAMTHIDGPLTMNLTASRGKRAKFTVQPLQQPQTLEDTIRAQIASCETKEQLRELWDKLPPAIKEILVAEKDNAKQRLENK